MVLRSAAGAFAEPPGTGGPRTGQHLGHWQQLRHQHRRQHDTGRADAAAGAPDAGSSMSHAKKGKKHKKKSSKKSKSKTSDSDTSETKPQ